MVLHKRTLPTFIVAIVLFVDVSPIRSYTNLSNKAYSTDVFLGVQEFAFKNGARGSHVVYLPKMAA